MIEIYVQKTNKSVKNWREMGGKVNGKQTLYKNTSERTSTTCTNAYNIQKVSQCASATFPPESAFQDR